MSIRYFPYQVCPVDQVFLNRSRCYDTNTVLADVKLSNLIRIGRGVAVNSVLREINVEECNDITLPVLSRLFRALTLNRILYRCTVQRWMPSAPTVTGSSCQTAPLFDKPHTEIYQDQSVSRWAGKKNRNLVRHYRNTVL